MNSYHYLTKVFGELSQETLKKKTRGLEMGHERENTWKPKMKKRGSYSKDTPHKWGSPGIVGRNGAPWELWEEVGFPGNCGKKRGSPGTVERGGVLQELWEEMGLPGTVGISGGSPGAVGRSGVPRELWEEVGFTLLDSLMCSKKCTLLVTNEASPTNTLKRHYKWMNS